MIWLILAIAVVGAFLFWAYRASKLDANNDGKIDHKDVADTLTEAVTKVKSAADLNQDGKVDSKDAAVAVKGVKATARGAKAAARRTVNTARKRAKKES